MDQYILGLELPVILLWSRSGVQKPYGEKPSHTTEHIQHKNNFKHVLIPSRKSIPYKEQTQKERPARSVLACTWTSYFKCTLLAYVDAFIDQCQGVL